MLVSCLPLAVVLLANVAAAPAAATGSASAPSVRPWVLSTLPFDNVSDQQAIFNALRQPLEAELGHPVRFEAGKTYQGLVERLGRGEVDIALVGAWTYVDARKKSAVHAILRAVRKGASSYHGVLVVPHGATLKSVAELRGKRVAFVDKQSTSGYLYPRMLLKKAGLDPEHDITAVFVGSHRRVVELVAAGGAEAGACFAEAPELLEDPAALRVLAQTAAIPGDPVIVGPALTGEHIKKLRRALIDLATNPQAASFFSYAGIDGFVPAGDHDYDALAAEVAGSF